MSEFKSDLRALADKLKQDATVTGDVAVATAGVFASVLAEAGLTPEQDIALSKARALVANAGALAGGELAGTHFTNNADATNFSLTIPGTGRDQFDVAIKRTHLVNIPANAKTGAPAREEMRALAVSSARWNHSGARPAAEFTQIKQHLNQLGAPLLAGLAKNNE